MARTTASKRGGFLALAMGCVLLVTGCGESDGDGPTNTDDISGTVTVWDTNYKSFDGYTEAADQLDEKFEEMYPDVKIDRVAQPAADYDKLLQTSFTAREGADVLLLTPGSQGVLRWQKGLKDLTKDVADIREDLTYWESASPGFDADGDVYGVPIGSQADIFYYNKSLFKKAGLDPEAPPTTWDEMVQAADALKDAGITPFASGNKEGYENQWWMSIIWGGLNTVDDTVALASGDMPFTDDKVVGVLEQYQDLQDSGYFADDRFSTPLFPDGVDSFSAGDGAMFLGLSDVAAHWGVFNEALGEDNVGIFQAPGISGDTANALPVGPTYDWSIPAYTDNYPAALAYVKFLSSLESQQLQYDVAQSLPNRSDVDLTDAPPQVVQMVDDFQSAETFMSPHQLIPGVVLTQYTTDENEVLQGRMDLDDMLESLQSANEQALGD